MMSRWRFDMRTHLAVTPGKTLHEEDRMKDIHIGKKDQRQQMKNNLTNGGRHNGLGKKLRVRVQQRLPIHLLLWNILRAARHEIGRGPDFCRRQVMLMTTYKFPRWMHSTRWMHERVVTSEKCWIGIEEKMQTSREVG